MRIALRSALLWILFVVSVAAFYVTCIEPDYFNKPPGITEKEVKEIYKNLAIKSGSQKNPPLVIVKDGDVNAYYDGATITVLTGLMEAVKNKDELAMVLAHEMSHAMQHHVWNGLLISNGLDSREVEANADRMGAFLMLRAGYDVCKGKEVFRYFRDHYGEDPTATSHPIPSYRLNLMHLPWCNR